MICILICNFNHVIDILGSAIAELAEGGAALHCVALRCDAMQGLGAAASHCAPGKGGPETSKRRPELCYLPIRDQSHSFAQMRHSRNWLAGRPNWISLRNLSRYATATAAAGAEAATRRPLAQARNDPMHSWRANDDDNKKPRMLIVVVAVAAVVLLLFCQQNCT